MTELDAEQLVTVPADVTKPSVDVLAYDVPLLNTVKPTRVSQQRTENGMQTSAGETLTPTETTLSAPLRRSGISNGSRAPEAQPGVDAEAEIALGDADSVAETTTQNKM